MCCLFNSHTSVANSGAIRFGYRQQNLSLIEAMLKILISFTHHLYLMM